MQEHKNWILMTLWLTAVTAVAEPPVPGAKELCYDPAGRDVASVPAPADTAVADPEPDRSTTRVPVDTDGRRKVNLPADSEAAKARQALGISYWIELVGPAEGSGAQVTASRVFRSGDRIRLHFRSNADGRIALIQLGSSGTSRFLFPDPTHRLIDSRMVAGEERILPSASHWFRFDDHPGTEKLLVLFARSQEELDGFRAQPSMDERETESLMRQASYVQGSKDLVIETETRKASEIGTYGVNLAGQPVVLEIALEHR